MSTEERDSQLSALLDGELEASQAELVTRRLLKDPALQATWGRYALIGAVLRKEPLLDGGLPPVEAYLPAAEDVLRLYVENRLPDTSPSVMF
jgi:anti-sigma factor RsiW